MTPIRPRERWATAVQVLAIAGLTAAIALIQFGRIAEGIGVAVIGLVAIDFAPDGLGPAAQSGVRDNAHMGAWIPECEDARTA